MKSDLRDRAALPADLFQAVSPTIGPTIRSIWRAVEIPSQDLLATCRKEATTQATRVNQRTSATGREVGLISLDVRELRHSVTRAECFDVAARTGMARETLPY